MMRPAPLILSVSPPAGDQEHRADSRPLQHVEQAVDAFVARSFRDRDRGVVDDVHEARRVPLGRDVQAAVGVGGRDEAERRMGEPVPLGFRQPVRHLGGGGRCGMTD
jgi:hypothetical protein